MGVPSDIEHGIEVTRFMESCAEEVWRDYVSIDPSPSGFLAAVYREMERARRLELAETSR